MTASYLDDRRREILMAVASKVSSAVDSSAVELDEAVAAAVVAALDDVFRAGMRLGVAEAVAQCSEQAREYRPDDEHFLTFDVTLDLGESD